ncbi:hypothetical protein L7F22_033480 [Adiantum nelumboides]|nr:hypothetical protein [Adiantum nelumboides]
MMIGPGKGYTPVEHTVLALMFATRKFRPYLLLKKFVILTVEEVFPYVLQHIDVSSWISKWLIRLKEFEYTVQLENSTRASLGGILTHRHFEKKVKPQGEEVLPSPKPVKLKEAHSLYFDGAYKRIIDKAATGVVVFDEEGEKIFSTSELLKNSHSNNEVEYAALILGLEWCVNNKIHRLNVYGDAKLLVKQIKGIWACKNHNLLNHLKQVKELMRHF